VIPNTNNYDLIVAADGSSSNTKKKLKTPSFHFKYDQMCITAKVLLRGCKSNEAFEILNSEGPFAVLPLGGDLFQIICSQSVLKGTYNMNLSKSLFLDYLSTILPYGIASVGDVIWYVETYSRPNSLVRFDTKTEEFQSWAIPSGGGIVRHMVATEDGNLVLACSAVNGIAQVYIET